jgi:hypothetical protein
VMKKHGWVGPTIQKKVLKDQRSSYIEDLDHCRDMALEPGEFLECAVSSWVLLDAWLAGGGSMTKGDL